MKTILHIIDTTGPGGAETVFIDLLTRLPKNKFKAVVVIRGKGWVYDELIRRGVTPVLLDAKGSFNWRYLLQLRKIIKQEGVDLIQSHLLGSNVYSALVGLLTGVPVVATFHGAVDIGENERLKGLKFAAINFGTKRIIAVSENLRADIISRTRVNKNKLRTIYNGIAIDEFSRPASDAIRDKFGWSKNTIIVGSLGNVRTAKAYDILLHAAALLKNKSEKFKFVIAGQCNTGLYDKLLSLRAELKLDNDVYFLGFNDNPAEFLSNLDIFLLSSISEGFSIATVQAMATGIPVIATKSGGPEEIISHGENGWLVDAGNPLAIKEGLEQLTDNPLILDKMSKKASDQVKTTFNMARTLSAYEAVYNEIA
ncbi:FIG040338: Glycosyl transferase [hydrothermal vent metagenome]|uniref:FIG040338: Glycosyl transferase n=1 Tax=hydrothermal vent metagenome TaxID=652676 RepID=A0A3B1AES3_9ZZZZ